MQLKIHFYQNGCYLPLEFLKDWPSNLEYSYQSFFPWVYSARTKTKHLTDGCSKIFTLHSSSTWRAYNALQTISNRFNSTAVHLELYETCLLEYFCESNEQLKEVIYFIKDLHHRSLTGLVYTGLHFSRSFPFNLLYIKDKNPAEYNYWACRIEKVSKF